MATPIVSSVLRSYQTQNSLLLFQRPSPKISVKPRKENVRAQGTEKFLDVLKEELQKK